MAVTTAIVSKHRRIKTTNKALNNSIGDFKNLCKNTFF